MKSKLLTNNGDYEFQSILYHLEKFVNFPPSTLIFYKKKERMRETMRKNCKISPDNVNVLRSFNSNFSNNPQKFDSDIICYFQFIVIDRHMALSLSSLT